MLEKIQSPGDLKNSTLEQRFGLAQEIRTVILETVSQNGGHLASNLGMVETTLALHYVFDMPRDTLLFDVGHQCYAHKLLTGRYPAFSGLRRKEGLSGFTNPKESSYDKVFAGHSGSALSIALGVAEAKAGRGDDSWTVCVIGDGSLTNGMVFEALNNCIRTPELKLLILLNDNEMAISRNVGGFSRYLNKVRTSHKYYAFKRGLETALRKIPWIGKSLADFAKGVKDLIKRILRQKTVFENLGIPYLGILDGNDLKHLEEVLGEARKKEGVCLVHVLTQKGKGYGPAETTPEIYHAVGPFDLARGVVKSPGDTFSSVAGETLVEIGREDKTVCAVTAAMAEGTGLSYFAAEYPERFYDVGIAEEHAVAFSAGMALQGQKPACALYATFAQRVYDQLFQDVCLQEVPFLLLLDRAGLVPGDGRTHQGIFDVALFSSLPHVTIWSPDSYEDLREEIRRELSSPGCSIIRYSKGREMTYDRSGWTDGTNAKIRNADQPLATVITYGRITFAVMEALQKIGAAHVRVLKLERIFPLPEKEIEDAVRNVSRVMVVEEGVRAGGISEKIGAFLNARHYEGSVSIKAVENEFFPQGTMEDLWEMTGLSVGKLASWMQEKAGDTI